MQFLPAHQQSLATGVQNTLNRLSATVGVGIATAIYSSIESTPQSHADPMLKYTRAFMVSTAMAAVCVLFVPWLRLGTQGNEVSDPKLVSDKGKGSPASSGSPGTPGSALTLVIDEGQNSASNQRVNEKGSVQVVAYDCDNALNIVTEQQSNPPVADDGEKNGGQRAG